MAQSSDQLDSRSRKNLSTILKALGSAGQVHVAEAIRKDESTVSKMKDKELPLLARLLAACGLKVVPVTVECYDPQLIGAVFYLARGRLDALEGPRQLEWEEPE